MTSADAGSLHFALNGTPALLPGVRLSTLPSFLLVSLFAVSICICERVLSASLTAHSFPFRRRTRRRFALWRAGLYWLATLFRLLYMLLTMSLHIPLILVIVSALAGCQLVIELRAAPAPDADADAARPDNESALSLIPRSPGRPRARSKPDAIFIHPLQSNVARADALFAYGNAQEALAVRPRSGAWDEGTAREAARALLRPKHEDQERRPLYGTDDSDSEDE